MHPTQPQPRSGTVTIYTDGASEGNAAKGSPHYGNSRAAYGWVAYGGAKMEIQHGSGFLGNGTNVEAEFHGLLAGLTWVCAKRYKVAKVRTDSKNVAGFLNGSHRISQVPHLARLQRMIAELISCEAVPATDGRRRLKLLSESQEGKLVVGDVSWVPRSQNRRADALAGRALQTADRR